MLSSEYACNHEIHFVDKLYGSNEVVSERHRHRYEVNPDKVAELESKGLKFVGKDDTGQRMEIVELKCKLTFQSLGKFLQYNRSDSR